VTRFRHDFLTTAGVRSQCEIAMVLPLSSPVPPSPDTSKALIAAFAERNIKFLPNRRVASVDAARRIASLDDGSELPYDLFLGVPKHRAPAVVEASGLAEAGWVNVNPGDKIPECLRHRRYREYGNPEGRRFRRGRGQGGGEFPRLTHSRSGRRRSICRCGDLLHRVRLRSNRPRRRRFLLRPQAYRHLP
jgi:hypothetical protein